MREFQRAFGRAARDGEVIELPGAVGCRAPRLGGHSLVNAAIADDAGVLPELARRYGSAEVWGVWAHESDAALRTALSDLGMQLDSSPTAMGRELGDSLSPVPGVEPLDDLDVFDAVEFAGWDFPAGTMAEGIPGVLHEFRCYPERAAAGAPGAIVATVHHRGDCGVTL